MVVGRLSCRKLKSRSLTRTRKARLTNNASNDARIRCELNPGILVSEAAIRDDENEICVVRGLDYPVI